MHDLSDGGFVGGHARESVARELLSHSRRCHHSLRSASPDGRRIEASIAEPGYRAIRKHADLRFGQPRSSPATSTMNAPV
jgi:hypothetical protein